MVLSAGVIGAGTATAGDGYNLLRNGDFAFDTDGWTIQRPEAVEVTQEAGAEPDAPGILTFTIPANTKCRIVFYQDLDLSLADTYELILRARADAPIGMLIAPQRAEGDYGSIGSGGTLRLTGEWQEHRVTLKVQEPTSNGRITFLADEPMPSGRVQFSDIRLEIVVPE